MQRNAIRYTTIILFHTYVIPSIQATTSIIKNQQICVKLENAYGKSFPLLVYLHAMMMTMRRRGDYIDDDWARSCMLARIVAALLLNSSILASVLRRNSWICYDVDYGDPSIQCRTCASQKAFRYASTVIPITSSSSSMSACRHVNHSRKIIAKTKLSTK